MSARHGRSAGSPPRTPQRQLRSSNTSFASTTTAASLLRNEEDAVIFEFGSRWLRAGYEGMSAPIGQVGFGPEDSRRAGDYRGWLKGTAAAEASRTVLTAGAEDWAGAYELWNMNLREVDMGLVEDKIERAFREMFHRQLLTDPGVSRLALVLPSTLPHPLLSAVLSTLFSRWRFPSITLLTGAAMATTAAGLRSALVVDLGWAETTVSGIYEYREVLTKRSTRAMKSLLQETGRLLTRLTSGSAGEAQPGDRISVDFEFCEEVVSRIMWCRPFSSQRSDDSSNNELGEHDREQEQEQEQEQSMASILDKTLSIPSPSNPEFSIDMTYSQLTEPIEKALFAQGVADAEMDDEEKSIPLLVYNALLSLPPDARGTCMSRIVFIGGGANIPGIRRRILDEVARLVEQHGWSPVRGKAVEQQRQRLQALKLSYKQTPTSTAPSTPEDKPAETTPPPTAADQTDRDNGDGVEIDPVEQKILRYKEKDVKPGVHGVLREVDSLGPWAGASLLCSIKIRGLVEIEREKYLQHGLAGASRDLEMHGYVPDRRSGLRAGGDRSSWTLAGWG